MAETNENFDEQLIDDTSFMELLDPNGASEAAIHSSTGDDRMLSLTLENYPSRDALLDDVRKVAYSQGYAVVIRKSKAEHYVIVGCDRGGIYKRRKIEPGKRKSSSRLINCPFEIWGKMKKKPDIVWKVEIKCLLHNHESSIDMSGHPSCRRFTIDELSRIEEMTMAGVPPRQIMTSLRQNNPKLQAISKNVYNTNAQIRKKSLLGRTPIEALMDELGKGGFTYNVEYDQDGHLTHLFFAHPSSIILTKRYSNVFVMDCTYKTNRYKMPLLDIIGVSSFNGSFYSCFVFLQKEEEEDYVWALKMFSRVLGIDKYPSVIVSDRELALMNAISVVFPNTTNLLCVWHIEKNILAKCRNHFKDEPEWIDFVSSWNSLIQCSTPISFDEALMSFEIKYKEYTLLLSYIKTTWIPYKNKFVRAWTEEVLHCGNRVSSRAEGAHSMLKQYLQVSTGDLRDVKQKICLAVDNQFHEIKARLSSEKIRLPHRFGVPFFKELVTHVSVFAMDAINKQYELAKSNELSPNCKGHFFRSMGLPCAHMIRDKGFANLQLGDIHEQWKIGRALSCGDNEGEEDQINTLFNKFKEKYQELPISQKDDTQRQLFEFMNDSRPLILEPKLQPHKGRPVDSKNKKGNSSVKRDPSAFEIVTKTRKCSSCQGLGHDRRNCQLKSEANSINPSMINVFDLSTPFYEDRSLDQFEEVTFEDLMENFAP